jgi:cation diffusion facilitator family transporter
MTERSGLLFSTCGNLLIGVVGVTVALLSHSQAILLDGLFNLTYVATGLFTLRVVRLVHRGDDERFPAGYGFFEPLINGIKGLMVLGVSAMALVGSVEALMSGGRAISPGLATIYGIIATVICWSMALITHRGATRTASPLLKADAENWLVNGAISSAVLLAFISIFLIQKTSFSTFIPYIDPLLVLSVVLLSISVPIRMAWNALMELLNRAPSSEITSQVENIVEQCIGELPVQELFVRVLQPGRTRIVSAHVVLPADFHIGNLSTLDNTRERTLMELKKIHPSTMIDMLFTADRCWGAPASQNM